MHHSVFSTNVRHISSSFGASVRATRRGGVPWSILAVHTYIIVNDSTIAKKKLHIPAV